MRCVEDAIESAKQAGYSDALCEILRLGSDNGCTFVRIDGDGTIYGLGVTVGFYQLIHGVVRKWKPTRWICRGFIFELADTSLVEIAFGL